MPGKDAPLGPEEEIERSPGDQLGALGASRFAQGPASRSDAAALRSYDRSARLTVSISRRLHHFAGAGLAGISGTARHDHLQLRRDNVEPFGDILADPVLEAAAARAGLVGHVDNDLFARQMRRQCAAIDLPFARRDRLCGRLLIRLRGSFHDRVPSERTIRAALARAASRPPLYVVRPPRGVPVPPHDPTNGVGASKPSASSFGIRQASKLSQYIR